MMLDAEVGVEAMDEMDSFEWSCLFGIGYARRGLLRERVCLDSWLPVLDAASIRPLIATTLHNLQQ